MARRMPAVPPGAGAARPSPRPGRIWAFTGVAALRRPDRRAGGGRRTRGGGDRSPPAQPASHVERRQPRAAAEPPRPGSAAGRGPPTIRGADPTGEDCEGGFPDHRSGGWASQGVRGSPEATCSFVGSVLKAYWDVADPSRDAALGRGRGGHPVREGAACVGNDFFVTCSAEGADPWITCRGGRGAVVVLY